ncbi:inositol monophosphatase family protein [Maritalea sp.]|uniref:inositol monophosphatase family protein n=1 Tax=Maritalea sp. TaxID=2003361 RepID=UPI003EF835FF
MYANETRLMQIVDIISRASAEIIMPSFRALPSGSITKKTSDTDLVTHADLAAEEFICEALLKMSPSAAIVGEEAVAANPGLLSAIAEAELCFIVDPIDGTLNYAWGAPLFGSMLAIVENGITTAGLIYDPVTGDFLTAVKGSGAHAHFSQRRDSYTLSVAGPCDVPLMNGFVQTPQYPKAAQPKLLKCMHSFNQIFWYGCSAYEYRLLCDGKLDFSLQTFLKPWDHAAGQLIHTEAGGYSAMLDGKPYRPAVMGGGLLLARDKARWQQIRVQFENMDEFFASSESS